MSKARRRHVRLLNIILSHNARIFRYFVHVPSCLKLWQLHILRYFCSPTYILICTYVFPFPQSHSSVHSCACMYTLYYSRISLYLYAYNIRASRFSNTEMRIPPPFDIYMYTFTHSRTVFLLCVGGAPVPCAESVDGERGERGGGGEG